MMAKVAHDDKTQVLPCAIPARGVHTFLHDSAERRRREQAHWEQPAYPLEVRFELGAGVVGRLDAEFLCAAAWRAAGDPRYPTTTPIGPYI
eukprot:COSAG05_NODE_2738_length_2706_cov_5.319141_3_plen_91_part_00